jgi:hypothetical protein
VGTKFPEIKVILTYSDSSHHTGAIYKATNAVYQGESAGKKRWVYPIGSKSQKNWVINNLKSNIDWKTVNECLNTLETMWRDIGK